MVVTYCTATQVAELCQLTAHDGSRANWGTSPPYPTQAEVEALINVAEEIIEKRCFNAWGNRTVTITDELHDFFRDRIESSIHLRFPNVVTFDSNVDKLEVWDGNSWVDYLDTYTEGRDEDFFVDYYLGKIYFINQKPSEGKNRIRVTYRYNGGAAVPEVIKMATALQVGIFLANNPATTVLFPTGEDRENIDQLIDRWQRQIDMLLKRFERNPELMTGGNFIPVNY